MNADFSDITDRISEPPVWWDTYGVPRWCVFSPSSSVEIYTSSSELLEVQCACCGRKFLVNTVSGDFREYGDPPYHKCPGDHNSVILLRVVQSWIHVDGSWVHLPDKTGIVTHARPLIDIEDEGE